MATDIVPFAGVRSGYNHGPGDKRPRVARPMRLNRQRRQVNLSPLLDHSLSRRRSDKLGSCRKSSLQHRPPRQRIAQPIGWSRGAERGQKRAKVIQTVNRNTKPRGDAFSGSEEVYHNRDVRALALSNHWPVKPQNRSMRL